MKIDTSLTHLDAMIRQGYRTRKTLVWGVPVSQSTLQHEREAFISQPPWGYCVGEAMARIQQLDLSDPSAVY